MSVIQAIPGDEYKTSEHHANSYIASLMHGFTLANTEVDVFDRYDKPDSTKAEERTRRSKVQGSQPGRDIMLQQGE